MADGLFISAEGDLLITAAGDALETVGEKCPECGCGGEGTWPTSGWIVCSPCPGEPTPSKTVIAQASQVQAAFLTLFGGTPPFACVTGRIFDPAAGRNICVTIQAGSASIEIAGNPSSSLYLIGPTFPTLQTGTLAPYFSCCECRANYANCWIEKVQDFGVARAGVSINIGTPRNRVYWKATAPNTYEYRCCCPKLGNGVTRRAQGSYNSYASYPFKATQPTGVVQQEYWVEAVWDVTFTLDAQQVVGGTTRTRAKSTYADGSVQDSGWTAQQIALRTSCMQSSLWDSSFAVGSGYAAKIGSPYNGGGFLGINPAEYTGGQLSGSISASCGSASGSYVFTYTVDGQTIRQEASGSETWTTIGGDGNCDAGCGGPLSSPAACAAMTYRGTNVPYVEAPMPAAIAEQVLDDVFFL